MEAGLESGGKKVEWLKIRVSHPIYISATKFYKEASEIDVFRDRGLNFHVEHPGIFTN